MKTKLGTMMIAALMLFSFSLPAFAAEAGVSVAPSSSDTIQPGQEITFTITVTGTEGVTGLQADVEASPNLTFKSASKPASVEMMGTVDAEQIVLARSTNDGIGKNLVLTYVYTVNSDATPGDVVTFNLKNILANDSKKDASGTTVVHIGSFDGTASATWMVSVKVAEPEPEPEPEPKPEPEPQPQPEPEPEAAPAPAPVKDDVPKTGDESLPVWPFVALAAVVCVEAGVQLHKKGAGKQH